jgi:hypothetical protein
LFVAVFGEDAAGRWPESGRTEEDERGGKGNGEGEGSEGWQEGFWMFLTSIVECQTGVVVVTALLASAESNSDDEKDKVERGRDANDVTGRVLKDDI